MNLEIQAPLPAAAEPHYSVPWKYIDNWIAIALLAILDVVIFLMIARGPRNDLFQSVALVILETAYLLPVVLILAWRRIHWKQLGFGGFAWKELGLGCGALIAGYSIIMVYSVVLLAFGVETQGEQIVHMLSELESPVWFFIAAAVFAPLVEEIFFRGFFFQGLRARHGWITASLISSAVFAIAHLDLVTLIPTFVLGNVLAFAYHRTNSVWPGIILHGLVNGFSSCIAYMALQNPNLIPV